MSHLRRAAAPKAPGGHPALPLPSLCPSVYALHPTTKSTHIIVGEPPAAGRAVSSVQSARWSAEIFEPEASGLVLGRRGPSSPHFPGEIAPNDASRPAPSIEGADGTVVSEEALRNRSRG